MSRAGASRGHRRRTIHLNLAMKLLIATVFSVALGYLAYLAADAIGSQYIDDNYTSDEASARDDAKLSAAFRGYVSEHGITLADNDAISQWAIDNVCYVMLYSSDTQTLYTYYDSAAPEDIAEYGTNASMSLTQSEFAEAYDQTEVSNVTFADGTTAKLSLFYERPYGYYDIVMWISIAIGCIFFLVVFLLIINRKIAYIRKLESELQILEGGDLEFVVTEKSHDEITQLAHGINAMREAIVAKEAHEHESQEANRKLVTALSHDVRTPLTSLIGYLEILKLHRYEGTEQLDHYIEASKTKANQIRDLSDKMFEYFLVTGGTEELYEMVDVEAEALLYSIVEDQVFDLENSGWKVDENLSTAVVGGVCHVDPEYLRRVFDNIVSNIRKYGEISQPVVARVAREGGRLVLSFSNTVGGRPDSHESTGVGFQTCRKIMDDMRGSFATSLDGDVFTVSIELEVH